MRPLSVTKLNHPVVGESEQKRRTFEVPSPPDHCTENTLPGFAGTTSSAFCALRPQMRSGLDDPFTGPMSDTRRMGLGPIKSSDGDKRAQRTQFELTRGGTEAGFIARIPCPVNSDLTDIAVSRYAREGCGEEKERKDRLHCE